MMGRHGPSLGPPPVEDEVLLALEKKVSTALAQQFIADFLPNARRMATMLVVASLADVASTLGIFRFPGEEASAYDISSSEIDSIVFAIAGGTVGAICAALSFRFPNLPLASYWFSVLRMIFLLGKAVAFNWKQDNESGVGLLVLSMTMTAVEMFVANGLAEARWNLAEVEKYLRDKQLAMLSINEADEGEEDVVERGVSSASTSSAAGTTTNGDGLRAPLLATTANSSSSTAPTTSATHAKPKVSTSSSSTMTKPSLESIKPPTILVDQVRQEELEALEQSGGSTKSKRKALAKPQLSTIQLFRVMRPYFWPEGIVNKLRCFMTWTLLATSKACVLLAPIFVGRAVQTLSTNGTAEDVYPDIVRYVSLLFVSKLANESQSVVYLSVKQNAFAEISQTAFEHLHTLGLEWHLKKKLGQTMRALDRGIAAADTVMTYLFLYLLPSFFELIATMIVFKVHFNVPGLSAAAFICFACYTLVTVRLTLWRKRFRESSNRHDNDFHDKATDSLVNYETVKYFGAEKWETTRYVESVRKYQTFSTAVQASLSLLNVSQQFILQSCLLACLCISAHNVARGTMEVGSFISIQVYVVNLFAPLSFLGTIYNAVVQAFTDMVNFSQLLAEEPDVSDAPDAIDLALLLPPASAPSIEFDDVHFSYPSQPDGKGCLRGVSFVVPGGTETAICGATGAGKSTIFRLLFRFYDVKGGDIRVAGVSTRRVTLQSLRRAIGVVPQDTVLFNDTIRYNVQYGNREASFEEIRRACANAQILEKIESLPQGWDTVVGERGLKLSGGEKQRVAIARCFLKNAPVLVLDEWSSALDVATERNVHSTIADLSQARTVLVIAHRLSTIKRSSQILTLENGLVAERGTHEQLLADPNSRYAKMWRMQEEAASSSAPGSGSGDQR